MWQWKYSHLRHFIIIINRLPESNDDNDGADDKNDM